MKRKSSSEMFKVPSLIREVRAKGFALVATLSLLVLLALVALGMLTLSSLVVRSVSLEGGVAEARANARLALMIAIGELQKGLGPDQRISAQAGLLDESPESGDVDAVANPHYLGVWDSWNTWLTDEKDSLSIQDTYQRGRHPSLFRAWLVSHPESDAYETAPTVPPSEGAALMVGEGSVGTDQSRQVRAERVPIQTSGRVTGSYAWWVSDESLKSRVDLESRGEAATIAEAQVISADPGRPGVETMEGMSDFDPSPETLAKSISLGQVGLSAGAAGVRERFHDLTVHSVGLHTDVRWGGFKRDLNLAFESEELPEEMARAELFGGRPFDAPIRPMTGTLGDVVPRNPYIAPMSWRQLREYYRLYRGFPNSGSKHPVTWEGGQPVTTRFIMGGGRREWDVGGYARQLVILRQTWILATSSELDSSVPGGIAYHLLAVPVIYLWNPYNISMKVDSREMSSLGSMFYSVGMKQKVYRGSTLVGEFQFPYWSSESNIPRDSHDDLTNRQLGYRMIPTEERARSPIEFQPGEVRVFSTNSEIVKQGGGGGSGDMLTRFFYATPGYAPVEDTDVLRGLKYRIDPGPGGRTPSLSLRLADANHCDNRYFGASQHAGLTYSMQEVLSARQGAYYEDGNLVSKKAEGEWHDVARVGAISVDWVRADELASAWIIRDEPAYRARWGNPGSPPMPVGIFSIVAKSAERLHFDGRSGFTKDFRNRSWLHAPPTGLANFLYNPVDLNRADSPYQLHFRPVNGDQEVSEYLQADGRNGYFGGGYTAASGQTHLAPLALPAAPITGLGAFAGIRFDSARAHILQEEDNYSRPRVDNSSLGNTLYKLKHLAHTGGAFGAGIGNAVAHPMIEPEEVYTRHDFGKDPGWQGSDPGRATNLGVRDDRWDQLFLANEELWDSWFCSGLAPAMKDGRVIASKKVISEDFFSGKPTKLSSRFRPYLRGRDPGELADLVEETSSSSDENGWDIVGSNILNRGQFNVNSTSKEAWKAIFMSLADRPVAVVDIKAGARVVPPDPNQVTLSRHPLANSETAATDPFDEHAWRGIRNISEDEVDKLADEMVRQVKLRGPFLNMADFINRRLSNDALGITGALQAAIDWDEFNAGFNGSTSGAGESINKEYKKGDSMILENDLPARYPNPKAASGSRYAGIPGYVMQSDLLQGIGSTLCVRGDTFLIRTYGESLTPDGAVAARAWCEAVVQRMPEFVDPSDAADLRMRPAPGQLSIPTPSINSINQQFGRQFRIVSFRWLNDEEV